MAYSNRAIVQRTFGLNELLANHAPTVLTSAPAQETAAQIRPLTYGAQFRYMEYMTVGTSRLAASVFSTLLGVWLALLFTVPPVSAKHLHLLGRVVGS